MEMILSCPVCENVLHRIEKRYECVNHHLYDIAREGYVNLLLANQKASILPGDSRDMLRARRRFLEAGHYNILSNALNQIVTNYFEQKSANHATIFEAGCGEGYYLGELQKSLSLIPHTCSIGYLGLDIAKDAVRMAAKRYQSIDFLVASTRRKIPIIDGSIDVLLTIFAPRNVLEYRRITTPHSIIIIVIPGKDHLRQLRATMGMPERENDKQDEVLSEFEAAFKLEHVYRYSDNISLDNAALLDLVKMTPNYWHVRTDTWDVLNNLDHFETQIDFRMLIFQRS